MMEHAKKKTVVESQVPKALPGEQLLKEKPVDTNKHPPADPDRQNPPDPSKSSEEISTQDFFKFHNHFDGFDTSF